MTAVRRIVSRLADQGDMKGFSTSLKAPACSHILSFLPLTETCCRLKTKLRSPLKSARATFGAQSEINLETCMKIKEAT